MTKMLQTLIYDDYCSSCNELMINYNKRIKNEKKYKRDINVKQKTWNDMSVSLSKKNS